MHTDTAPQGAVLPLPRPPALAHFLAGEQALPITLKGDRAWLLIALAPADLVLRAGCEAAAHHAQPGAFCLLPAGADTELNLAPGGELLAIGDPPAELLAAGSPVPLRCNPADATLVALARACLAEREMAGLASDLLIHAFSLALIAQAARAAARAQAGRDGRDYALAPHRLRRVTQYIDQHLDEPVCVNTLAEVAGLSAKHFARAFKQATGDSPHQYLLARRIERAKLLLANGDLPLAQVALGCGFGSQQQMTKVFTSATGVSPGRWRRGAPDLLCTVRGAND